MTMDQTPSVGRIVHYVPYALLFPEDGGPAVEAHCRAAMVIEVDPDNSERVGLHIFNPSEVIPQPLSEGGCGYHDNDESTESAATWHWPEVVA